MAAQGFDLFDVGADDQLRPAERLQHLEHDDARLGAAVVVDEAHQQLVGEPGVERNEHRDDGERKRGGRRRDGEQRHPAAFERGEGLRNADHWRQRQGDDDGGAAAEHDERRELQRDEDRPQPGFERLRAGHQGDDIDAGQRGVHQRMALQRGRARVFEMRDAIETVGEQQRRTCEFGQTHQRVDRHHDMQDDGERAYVGLVVVLEDERERRRGAERVDVAGEARPRAQRGREDQQKREREQPGRRGALRDPGAREAYGVAALQRSPCERGEDEIGEGVQLGYGAAGQAVVVVAEIPEHSAGDGEQHDDGGDQRRPEGGRRSQAAPASISAKPSTGRPAASALSASAARSACSSPTTATTAT